MDGMHGVVVCSVAGKDTHPEIVNISNLFTTIELPGDKQRQPRQKQKTDFIGCVARVLALQPDADLLLVLEDDALILEEFFPTLSSILMFHMPFYQKDSWLDIKLYTPPKWSGFGLDFQPLLELVVYSSILTTSYLASARLASRCVRI